jgi:GT2 family glycosyltransferase
MGFARANNVGLQRARGRHVLFLNPDAFLAEDALRSLVSAIERGPQVGVVGPRLVNEDESLQFSARNFPTVANQLFEALMLHKVLLHQSRRWGGVIYDAELYRQGGPVDWLSGAVLLVRREAIEEVGGFDERFFLYSEEKDLQLRLSKAGWSAVLEPDAVATHLHGDTYRPELFEISLRSKLAYNAKHERGLRRVAFDLALMLHLAVRVGLEAVSVLLSHKKSPRLSGYMRGMGVVLSSRKAQGGIDGTRA